MIRVIKSGKVKLPYPRKTVCPKCDCEFIFDNGDVVPDSQMCACRDKYIRNVNPFITCPECGSIFVAYCEEINS